MVQPAAFARATALISARFEARAAEVTSEWHSVNGGGLCPPLVFFQAEDGIRDYKVTGVQTCALPICWWGVCTGRRWGWAGLRRAARHRGSQRPLPNRCSERPAPVGFGAPPPPETSARVRSDRSTAGRPNSPRYGYGSGSYGHSIRRTRRTPGRRPHSTGRRGSTLYQARGRRRNRRPTTARRYPWCAWKDESAGRGPPRCPARRADEIAYTPREIAGISPTAGGPNRATGWRRGGCPGGGPAAFDIVRALVSWSPGHRQSA